MKHLLIILSILLLSSPVIGDSHKLFRFDSSLDSRSSLSIINYGETLYGWGEYPDYVWKGVGKKNTQPLYKGEVDNGVPNGLGILYDLDGSKYVGSWKNGKKNRQGTFTYPNGEKYVGEFKDGKEHGQGTLTFPDGGKYVGEFKNEEMWTGKFYDNNGNIEGKMLNGIID